MTAWGHRRVGFDNGQVVAISRRVENDGREAPKPPATGRRRFCLGIVDSDTTMNPGRRVELDGGTAPSHTTDVESNSTNAQGRCRVRLDDHSPFSSSTRQWPYDMPLPICWTRWPHAGRCRVLLDDGLLAIVEYDSTVASRLASKQALRTRPPARAKASGHPFELLDCPSSASYAAPVFCLSAFGYAVPFPCSVCQPGRVELSHWPPTFESNSIESTSIESISIESNTIESNTIAWAHDRIQHDCLDSRSSVLTIAWTHDHVRLGYDRLDVDSRSSVLTIACTHDRVQHDPTQIDLHRGLSCSTRSCPTRSRSTQSCSTRSSRARSSRARSCRTRSSRTRSHGLTIDSKTIESNTIEWNTIESIMIESNTIESNTVESCTIESNTIESNAIKSVIIELDTIESNTISLDSLSSRTRSSWPVTLAPNEIVLTTDTITIELNTIVDASSRRRCCLITIWNFSAPRAMPTLCGLLIFCFAVMCCVAFRLGNATKDGRRGEGK
ncbi:hypothetical protein CBR_g34014 [Chara braunii]|uniref:Uncharacterized protein n=1 Tax=Chara braunii TaxID=69332 RepID=A0A388LHW4_CHABU|nr:hypothetical protein CBR_g34014 [Chara braunii]|eukprot:GBG81833.1 hypothetical protein CBR_g34014 [Chara braunii]